MTNLPIMPLTFTNAVLTPEQQAAIQQLPPNWQHIFTLIMALLTVMSIFGRMLAPLLANQGLLSSFKAAFLGSAHATTTVTPAPAPSVAPVAPVTIPAKQ